jgi:K+-sensing histidine kinase KdpD
MTAGAARRRRFQLPERREAQLALWYGLGVASAAIDYAAGPYIQFPVAYLLPVLLAAWFDALPHALTLAVVLPAVRLTFVVGIWTVPWGVTEAVINAAIRMGVFGLVAWLAARVREQQRALTQEIRLLEKILPICGHCKKIRDREDRWHPLDRYIDAHSNVSLSHGICPDCAREHFPDFLDDA